jgi:hypothetical protein
LCIPFGLLLFLLEQLPEPGFFETPDEGGELPSFGATTGPELTGVGLLAGGMLGVEEKDGK